MDRLTLSGRNAGAIVISACALGVMLAVTPLTIPLCAQSTSQQGPYRMEIVLERRDGNVWRAVDPGLVLDQNDRVRFRFQTNFSGHLYVMNQSTSGTYSLLFPRDETGRDNQVQAGKEYLVTTSIVEDPQYLYVPWVTSNQFRREPDGDTEVLTEAKALIREYLQRHVNTISR